MCVDKATFYHPLESDGATILEATDAAAKTINMADDDGGTALNADGSERLRKVSVLLRIANQAPSQREASRGES